MNPLRPTRLQCASHLEPITLGDVQSLISMYKARCEADPKTFVFALMSEAETSDH